jgi:hypothetical protein
MVPNNDTAVDFDTTASGSRLQCGQGVSLLPLTGNRQRPLQRGPSGLPIASPRAGSVDKIAVGTTRQTSLRTRWGSNAALLASAPLQVLEFDGANDDGCLRLASATLFSVLAASYSDNATHGRTAACGCRPSAKYCTPGMIHVDDAASEGRH